jgi:hypothetical protein
VMDESSIELPEPTRNTLIQKFLDMGSALLGIEKQAHVAPKTETIIEENNDTMTDAQVKAIAKQYGLTEGEVHKRLSMKTADSLGKAMNAVAVAQKVHAQCMKALGKFATTDLVKGEDGLGRLMNRMGEAHDLAEFHIGKAAGLHSDLGPKSGSDEEVSPGNKDMVTYVDQSKLTEGMIDGLGMFAQDSPFSSSQMKSASVDTEKMASMVAAAIAKALEPVNQKLGDVEKENSYLKGQAAAFALMPGQAKRPNLFSMDKASVISNLGDGDETDNVNQEIAKAYQSYDPNDPDAALRASARIIGLRTQAPNQFGHSMADPNYKGAMGN